MHHLNSYNNSILRLQLLATLQDSLDNEPCRKDFPPLLLDSFSEQKCDMVWEDARATVEKEPDLEKRRKDLEGFEEVSILQINDAPLHPYTFFCYKKDNFRNKGWCKTSKHGNKWGICSDSCRFMGNLDEVKY